jgi:two-component system response regulator YesN
MLSLASNVPEGGQFMLKVLIVDDDDIIRQGLNIIIKKNLPNCEVIGEASDGELALEQIKIIKPDILITDIKMPIMDGIQLLDAISKTEYKIKTIVLSGFDEYKYVRKTFKYGIKDYLLKPIKKVEFLELINKICAEIESEREKDNKEQILNFEAEKGRALIAEKCLKQLVNNCYTDISELEDKLLGSNITVKGKFVIVAINIDESYKAKNLENCIRLLDSELSSMTEKIQDTFNCIKYIENANATILFQCKTVDLNNKLSDLKEKFKGIEEKLGSETSSSFTAGISSCYEDIGNAHLAYNEAKLSIDERFYKGTNNIIDYSELRTDYNNVDKSIVDSYVEILGQCIELCEANKAKKVVKDFFQNLLQKRASAKTVRDLCMELLSRLTVASFEFRDSVADYYMNEELELETYIYGINTYEEFMEYISKVVFNTLERIKVIREAKSKKIIEISKEYIEKHFRGDVSLNAVAQKVFLNPSYFSNLFKLETGMNFSEYLLEVRINEAKKLLANPEFKVYEIGQLVGYDESVSFGRAFKKKVGVSPADYRKIIK